MFVFLLFFTIFILYIYIEREREREKIIFYQKKNNKALDAILVLNKEEIPGHNRVDNVIKKAWSNQIHKKDETLYVFKP